MTEAKATIKNIRVSPKKMVLLASAIKGKDIDSAEWIIKSSGKGYIEYFIHALRNAESVIKEKGAVTNDIKVKNVEINQGPRLKRHRAGARGYSNNYRHALSHLTLTLSENGDAKKISGDIKKKSDAKVSDMAGKSSISKKLDASEKSAIKPKTQKSKTTKAKAENSKG